MKTSSKEYVSILYRSLKRLLQALLLQALFVTDYPSTKGAIYISPTIAVLQSVSRKSRTTTTTRTTRTTTYKLLDRDARGEKKKQRKKEGEVGSKLL